MNLNLNISDINKLKNIVAEAGNYACDRQKSNFSSKRKNNSSIVTEVDIQVQDMLIKAIHAEFKGCRFIHEEENKTQINTSKKSELCFIIDPIDGTAMYSMRLPAWCVSVGVFINNEPCCGFVYSPGFDMFFHCDLNRSYINDIPAKADPDMNIDSETNIFYSSEAYGEYYIDFPGKARNMGSTALHACLAIDNERNRTLAFIGKSNIWDWAGAIPILLKAGVKLKYIDGKDFKPDKICEKPYALTEYLVAYNTNEFEKVRKIFVPRK
jgi:myo-inositol-1(or 4)-monophosphatase